MRGDFEFVDSLYCKDLAMRADADGLSSLSEQEQNVLLAWWAKGEIDNGGFALLYASVIYIDDVERAFSAVGCPAAAAACRQSKLVFGNQVPGDLEARIKVIEAINDPSAGKDPWHLEDRQIWKLGDQFDTAVATYIRENPASFSDL